MCFPRSSGSGAHSIFHEILELASGRPYTPPKKWFCPYQANASNIFRLPGSQFFFAPVHDALLFHVLQSVGDGCWQQISALDSWYLEDIVLLVHPLEGWQMPGCLATWHASWKHHWRYST